jgi:hypothetical protein
MTKRPYFLDAEEAKFIEAFCTLIIPTGKDATSDPGAREVGTVNYIDSYLHDAPEGVRRQFRNSLRLVNDFAREGFSNDFATLADSDKNMVLRALILEPRTRVNVLFLRSLALEGFYSDYHDPWYTGVTAWQTVKFGGKRISELKKDWTFVKVWKEWEHPEGSR